MNDIISVKNLSYRYNENSDYIFNKISLNIKQESFTTFIGPIGSGKSTFIKALLGLIKVDGEIKIDGLILNQENMKEIRKKIGVVFENPDDTFVAETVMDEIAFSLENMNFSKKEIWKKVKEVGALLEIEDLMEKNPLTLSSGEKQLVSFASVIVAQPKIIILDEAFTMVDPLQKKKIFNILKDLNKDATIINITHDLDESLYSDDIVLLQSGQIILQGTKEEVLKEEKIIKLAGLKLPFLADLSIRLQYYGILDHMILDIDEMVNTIWK